MNLNKIQYAKAYIQNVHQFFITKERLKSIPKSYYGENILQQEEGSNYIKQLLNSDSPFVVGRFGSTECGSFHNYIKIKLGLKRDFKKSVVYSMENNAGFFPSDKNNLFSFGELMSDLYKEIDLLCVFNIFMEDFIAHNYCVNAQLTVLKSVDPILSTWTSELKGKKVLVIHPFAELIKEQYKKREYIFPASDKLPVFDLKVLKAVQTIAGEKDNRFSSWFKALDFMMFEISKIDFDVALIGAGAYGLPLAIKIKKELRKQAIQIGGATQLLFGIRGKRWDSRAEFNKFYNNYWTIPNQNNIPINASRVENGCYW